MKKILVVALALAPVFSQAALPVSRLIGGYGTADAKGLTHVAQVFQEESAYKVTFAGGCTAELKLENESLKGSCSTRNEAGQVVYYSAIVFIDSDEAQILWKSTTNPEDLKSLYGSSNAKKLY